MKIWSIAKNLMLATAITMLYAIWSKDGLHEVSTLHMWAILILVWVLVVHIIFYADSEIKKLHDERKKRRGRRNG